jgi:hypothetical protein
MNKKRKNILEIFLIVTVMIITGISLKYFNREKGTFYELEMSKNLANTTFRTVFVFRNNPSENQVNPQTYSNSEVKNTKVFNYLNEFELTEVKSAMREGEFKGINEMTFISSSNANVQVVISIFGEKCIRVKVFKDDTRKKYKEKIYKIDNGSIDSKHLEELLK